MTSFNGYNFTNLSGGDTLSDPDGFTNPTNATDDNDVTLADLTIASVGAEVTKTLGTTFAAATIVVARIKADIDLNLGSASYASQLKLQAFDGASWFDLFTLATSTTQTLSFDGLVRMSSNVQGLRVAFISTVDSGNDIDMDLFTLSYGTSFTYTAKNLLESLGGTNIEDLGDKTAISEDHTLTWNTMLNASETIGIAQNAYQILQANNIFDNKDFLAADEFLDSNGTNNTVNTGSSTAFFNTRELIYTMTQGTDDASGDTTHDPDGYTNPANAFDTDDNTAATFQDEGNPKSLGKTFSSRLIGYVRVVASTAGNQPTSITFETFNGATWDVVEVLASAGGAPGIAKATYDITLNATVQGVRITIESGNSTASLFTLEYGDFDTPKTVVCDANLLPLDGTENFLRVYADKIIPTNSTLTVDISDGTIDLLAQLINERIDISSLSSGTLKLTFNLASTDGSSPSFIGYGVYLK